MAVAWGNLGHVREGGKDGEKGGREERSGSRGSTHHYTINEKAEPLIHEDHYASLAIILGMKKTPVTVS